MKNLPSYFPKRGGRSPRTFFAEIFLVTFTILVMAVGWADKGAQAQTLPTGFSQVLVTDQLEGPTLMSVAPDGRIFISEETGALRIVKNGVLLAEPFIRLNTDSSTHLDLFGVAFDPDFSSNHYLYIYYTVPAGTHNRISRFTAHGDVAAPGSEVVVLDLDPNGNSDTHYGGTMRFGPDGKLYISTGDALNTAHSQNLDTYHGKILRINPDGTVPAGNPFTTGSPQKLRVWSYGLRNPHTMNFQPGTGKLFVNDVGEYSWEEINDATQGGLNFGWPFAEGTSSNPAYTNPLYQYAHGSGATMGCAITGGTFFNPATTNYPASYLGKYFYLDHCNNWIDVLTPNGSTATRSLFATNVAAAPLALETGADGNLYFLSYEQEALYTITYSTSLAPVITHQPQPLTVSQQNPATFRVTVTGAPPFTYQWRKNNVNLSGATGAAYTIPAVTNASAGTYSVVVSNSSGRVTSKEAILTVTPFNQTPTAVILAPASGTTYGGGQTIAFNGRGTDPENGALGASAFTWSVDFHHNSHVHPGPALPAGVTSGSFIIPNVGEASAKVYYRLYLVITDAAGGRDTAYVDILPRLSTIMLNTQPQGLQITLDGQPFTAPHAVTGVEGMMRTIGVLTPQTINAANFHFSGWSLGAASTYTFATPVADGTYTAYFNYLKVNFQDAATPTPAGWLRDFGQAFGPRTSAQQRTGYTYGWKKKSDKTLLDLTANGRKRSTPASALLSTLLYMQAPDAATAGLTPVEGLWEAQMPNGDYKVTVSVGDGAYLNSRHTVNVEGINAINNFVPTATTRFKSATVTVTVRDGLLTLDANGGFNTKINTVSIRPAVSIRTLVPVADALVRNGSYANTNYGDDFILTVESTPTGSARMSYLRFALDNITDVLSAKLRLYLHFKDTPASIAVSAFAVENDTWVEKGDQGITWNNAPAASGSALSTVKVQGLEQYYDFEVTDFVKAQLAGDKKASFVLKDPAQQGSLLTFNSKRIAKTTPQLILTTSTDLYCGASTLVAETFTYSPAANFTAVAGGSGKVAGGAYTLTAPATSTTGLGSIAIQNTTVSSHYAFTCDAKVQATASASDDFVLIFNYQNKNNYYYASFSEKNSATTHGIFKNVNGVVSQLADFTSLIRANTTYKIKIDQSGGLLKVYRDDVLQASVTDRTFTGGKVGLGSLNNTAVFDNLIVCAKPTTNQTNPLAAGNSARAATMGEQVAPPTKAPAALQVSVSPNPSGGAFTLLAKSNVSPEEITITVYDLYGRPLETRLVKQQVTFGSNYAPGVYIVKAIQGQQHTSLKIIKWRE